MRKPFAIAFIVTLVFFGVYMHQAVEAVCKTPLSYRIGHLDNRFGITLDEARVAVADAESIWEQATGKNLFTYDPEGKLVVNFIFDERQEFAEAEIDFREQLDAVQDTNETISEQHTALVAEYEELEVEYKRNVASYEQKLSAYNSAVEQYNREGGAPPDVFEELQAERETLDRELGVVNAQGRQLNNLAREINRLSERGNQLVENYNQSVGQYNDTFAEEREFTQGDYRSGTINIYKFVDAYELELVLAHELGHAISLGHVADETAILYHHLGAQLDPLQLTQADLDEFERVCGRTTRSWIERLFIRFGV